MSLELPRKKIPTHKVIVLSVVFLFFGFLVLITNLNRSKFSIKELVREDIVTYGTFTVSPDNQWFLYSSGARDVNDLIAFNINTGIKYNLTKDTDLGPLLSGQIENDCWSLDSKYCSIGDYYIDFNNAEPKVVTYSNDSKSLKIRSTPRTCSDCVNTVQDYHIGEDYGYILSSPNNALLAKTYSRGFLGDFVSNTDLYVVDLGKNKKYKVIRTKGNDITTNIHWSSDSKKLYFYHDNAYKYIEIN